MAVVAVEVVRRIQARSEIFYDAAGPRPTPLLGSLPTTRPLLNITPVTLWTQQSLPIAPA